MGSITRFIDHHYRHFNAATLKDAARAYKAHIDSGKKMMVTLAGAMSTAELGLSLAAMIREDKVQAITCTGANLEEDVYNLVAHDYYERVPHYRYLTAADERALLERKLNRVTDTCIPEEEAMRRVESSLLGLWKSAAARGERRFPHQYFYELLCAG
ncbi:deoxyhypusine synthase, partial [Thiohalocapsa halophila]